LIGLKLNKIGRIVELPDTPEIPGMIAHLVRIIGKETELDRFVRLGGTTAKLVPDRYWICSTFQVSKSGAIRSRKAGAFPPATSSSVRL
jgi:ribosomal L30p/L7e-like protein